MPRPTLPPTPASSTDLPGRDGPHLASLEAAFALPPPAMMSSKLEPDGPHAATTKRAHTPVSPLAPVAEPSPSKRRRASGPRSTTGAKEDFTLPPPPTRSRKIIQMKPRPPKSAAAPGAASAAAPTTSTATASSATSAPTKGKGASASSAAGRKVARKTAHSLIERRRRSKMNEEFAVLKQMIPACRNQEMHKLAILQAGIEYLGYLERCVTDLEANVRGDPTGDAPSTAAPSPEKRKRSADEDEMRDEPVGSARPTGSDDRRSVHASPSQLTSPAWTPSPAVAPHRSTGSDVPTALVSPAIPPNRAVSRDLDHEATEALLMLTKDRRGSAARGMSVKDLLTP